MKARMAQPDAQRRRRAAGGEGDVVAELGVGDVPVIARRRVERHRHCLRGGRRARPGEGVVDVVQLAGGLGLSRRDGDGRQPDDRRARRIGVAGAGLFAVQVVGKTRLHLDLQAGVLERQRVVLEVAPSMSVSSDPSTRTHW